MTRSLSLPFSSIVIVFCFENNDMSKNSFVVVVVDVGADDAAVERPTMFAEKRGGAIAGVG